MGDRSKGNAGGREKRRGEDDREQKGGVVGDNRRKPGRVRRGHTLTGGEQPGQQGYCLSSRHSPDRGRWLVAAMAGDAGSEASDSGPCLANAKVFGQRNEGRGQRLKVARREIGLVLP